MTDQQQPELWRTDPRERLLTAIDSTWAHGELDATPEQLVNAYAHHLAEKIRYDAKTRQLEEETELAEYGRELADLINPEAEAQR